jgi:hypothetical protein
VKYTGYVRMTVTFMPIHRWALAACEPVVTEEFPLQLLPTGTSPRNASANVWATVIDSGNTPWKLVLHPDAAQVRKTPIGDGRR